MKKVISTIISVVIMLCLSLTAFAEPELQTPSDDDISVCYLYTDKISGTLSISNKAATCKSTVRGISGTTAKIVITLTLQKKNGSSWNKYSSWTKTFNSWYAIYSNSKESLSSGTYRVKTVAKVYNGSAYETITIYSKTASC